MRVIGGEARGRRLVVPDLPNLRPTSDRVKEAMFDILEARELVEGKSVVDLFAGSGALGIEALSRGARSVTFVENDGRATRVIERNLAGTGFSTDDNRARSDPPEVRVVRAEAGSWAALRHGRVDVVLADPPYDYDAWGQLLERLDAGFLLLEHRRPLEVGGHYEISREYRYGGTLVTLLRDARPSSGDASGPDTPYEDNL